MKLLESNKSKKTKDKNTENVPTLGITNGLNAFMPNKLFGELLDLSSTNFRLLSIVY